MCRAWVHCIGCSDNCVCCEGPCVGYKERLQRMALGESAMMLKLC